MKYLPYALILVALFVGRWTAPDDSKEVERKYELERKYHLDQISKLNGALADRDKAGKAIREKMTADSLEFSKALKANNEAYLILKKKYESINYSRASVAELDSIRARLLALHSNSGK